jgi:aminomethyltransferase
MLEVRQPRLHREVDEHAGVVECGLNWLVDLEKEQFTGRDAVVAEAEADHRRATIGFAAPPDATVVGGATVLAGQRSIGRVLDAVSDPGLDQQLGLASVEAEFCASGLDLEVQHEGMPSVTVRTLSSPYRVPTSWSAIRR